MLITKEKILKDTKRGLKLMVIFTIAMFLPLLSPLTTANLSTTNLIISEIVIFAIFTFPFGCINGLRNIINTFNKINLIKKGAFVIVEDTITGIYIGTQSAKYFSNAGNMSLKKYVSERLQIRNTEVKGLKEGNKCILIFTDITKKPILDYPGNNYEIDVSLQEKISNIERICSQKGKCNNKIETQKSPVVLVKKQLLKDCINKSQIITIIIITMLIFMFLFMMVIFRHNLTLIIMYGLAIVFFLVWDILKISYVFEITKSIKNNNYKLVKDVVVDNGLNKGYDTHYLKFEKYKKNWYYMPDEFLFADAKVGDVFYMLFIPKESEPLQIYIEKNIIISEEVKNYIK